MPTREKRSVNFQRRYENALMCPVPRYVSLQGKYETFSGAKFFVATKYLELPMSNTLAYAEEFGELEKDSPDLLPPRINVRDTLLKYHAIECERQNREVFWVAFERDKGARTPQLRGTITLSDGSRERVGSVHYVARRPALKFTAVVVLDFVE